MTFPVGHNKHVTRAEREEILQTYLNCPETGNKMAANLGLSPTYAYTLANARGLLPRQYGEPGIRKPLATVCE